VPELPEVETIVRDLRPALAGRRFTRLQLSQRALRRPWSRDWDARLIGRRVERGERRGKWIVLALDGGAYLVFHLGMSGQLTVVPADEPVKDHTHITLGLDGGNKELRFRDPRRFGSAALFADRGELDRFFVTSGLGPEPWDLQPAGWRERLASTGRRLKAVLLDQRVVAGVGNIYADEALYQARLHPTLRGRDLDTAAADRLRQAITTVLDRAIRHRGSSIRDYVGGSGLQGDYQNELCVYGRTGEPCGRCGTPIERIRLAGRSTHYCPRCQPEGTTKGKKDTKKGKQELV
jgi:formamidopyrimidine-DNA glycosylase